MEEWRDIPGFEGAYQVSDLGRVRSLDRVVTGVWGRSKQPQTRIKRGQDLRAYVNVDRGGYRYVNLRLDGRQHMRRVACLVALAFLGPRPEGKQVCHENGLAHDDCLPNLRYDTPAGNNADKEKHGTVRRGERHEQSRLTEADVRRIKRGAEPPELLAAELGVHWGHINNIRRGVRWAHVQ